jgi:ubiquinone/menaquinone biosynthesis C-methylase UbiE
MADPNPEDRKRRLAAHFDSVAPTYDELNFLSVTARRFVELANLSAGMSVLDVATGTGIIPLLAAEKIGADGKIIGVDISEEMIAVAWQKFQSRETLESVQLLTGDAENLDFPNSSFDAVLCASSLFFIPDMSKALKEAKRVLKPNGFVMFNTFAPNFLQPLRQLWNERLQKHEIKLGSLPIHRIPDEAACETLLREAGFTQIEIKAEQLGYFHLTAEDRWREIVAGLEGAPLKKMSNEQREQIRAEHIADLQNLVTPKGIWADVPPIFAFGR